MDRVGRLLGQWFRFEMPVGRRFYFASGVALMAFKYLVDASMVALATHHFWHPLRWLHPMATSRLEGLALSDTQTFLLVLWALPFLWIGASMSARRAMDAGRSPWWSLFFFVPGLNLALMLVLSALPSRPEAASERQAEAALTVLGHDPTDAGPRLRDALGAIGASVALGLPLVMLLVLAFKSYGTGLFFGVPFGMGAIAGWWYNRRVEQSMRATMVVVVLGQVLLAGTLMVFALEGLLCIAMAFPIAMAIACMGGVLGGAIARGGDSAPAPAVLASLALPLALALPGAGGAPTLLEARTAVEIAAPPEVVWRHVVAFEPLDPPREWWFRRGIAYPVRARITGHGPGAVRRCEFSTGPFIEPITRWEEPSRLSFDVAASPPPLEEWSPYAHVFAPHLAHGFRARRGEFRLVPIGPGRTRLEGSTWYTLEFQPEAYWVMWSDPLVSSIHRRVLRHIRRLAELDAARPRLLESPPNL